MVCEHSKIWKTHIHYQANILFNTYNIGQLCWETQVQNHPMMGFINKWSKLPKGLISIIYSAFGKYSDPLTFYTFCDVTALF
jgi:hypothetical protein